MRFYQILIHMDPIEERQFCHGSIWAWTGNRGKNLIFKMKIKGILGSKSQVYLNNLQGWWVFSTSFSLILSLSRVISVHFNPKTSQDHLTHAIPTHLMLFIWLQFILFICLVVFLFWSYPATYLFILTSTLTILVTT